MICLFYHPAVTFVSVLILSVMIALFGASRRLSLKVAPFSVRDLGETFFITIKQGTWTQETYDVSPICTWDIG